MTSAPTFGTPSRLTAALLVAMLVLAGCATSPPTNKDNVCEIFREKRGWYHDANRSSRRWGAPIPVMLSFMYQESSFLAKARPPRTRLLWIIPWKRPASARGYSQATDETWSAYKKATGQWIANRGNFDDAIDFVGWYIDQSYRSNRISKDDAYHGYLAYHEGQGGFSRRSFRNKQWLKDTATQVAARTQTFTSQLNSCEKELRRPWYIRILPFF
jgi:hypothetical protein